MQLFPSGFVTADSKTAQVQTYKVVPTEDMNTALWHSVRFAQNEFSPPKIVVTWTTR